VGDDAAPRRARPRARWDPRRALERRALEQYAFKTGQRRRWQGRGSRSREPLTTATAQNRRCHGRPRLCDRG
jgi:hypothetical protein